MENHIGSAISKILCYTHTHRQRITVLLLYQNNLRLDIWFVHFCSLVYVIFIFWYIGDVYLLCHKKHETEAIDDKTPTEKSTTNSFVTEPISSTAKSELDFSPVASNPAILASARLPGNVFSSPLYLNNNSVIVGCRDNFLYCFSIQA